MDEIHEEKLIYYRRIENIIKNIEEDEVKANEAIRRQLESNPRSIGPANDLLRFLYILEQQHQSDSNEIRTKTRENLLEYIDQFRSAEEDNNDQESDELEQYTPIVSHDPQPTPVVHPPPSVKVQEPLLVPVTEPDCIEPKALEDYQKLLIEAQEYEKRYKTIDVPRKKQLESRIKEIMNKLRKDTFETLTNDLLEFLNGQEQKVSNQIIRISNDDERLLCLSSLASLIFHQFLGSDLTDIKTEIFLPLVCLLSENPQHKEFRIIFRDRLHKKCPYTVPYYPKHEPLMSDEQYHKAMGYIEKPDGGQSRLETETEFLNRISGLIRLFCKLLARCAPPFDKDPSYDWRWFASILNLPPRSNITSVIVRVFLDEAGEVMMKKYSTQFVKLIEMVQTKGLPRFQKVTSDDQMARLQFTLEKFTKNKF